MRLLIKNGTVIDPVNTIHKKADIIVTDDVISEITESGKSAEAGFNEIIDADGLCVMPGFVDLHVHFREPGFTHKETIRTGSLAAAHGGYTSVFCMPNTNPVIDDKDSYRLLLDIISNDASVHVYPVGAVTKGQAGEKLADIYGMSELGMRSISEDGKSVMDSELYRQAMIIAKELGITIFAHCEDINLVAGGVMNSGKRAKELGLKGISDAVEDIIVARDVLLAKETGAKLHLCHCSTADSVKILMNAKEDRLPVSGEACPHHFTLCDADIPGDDANYKMNPPLRSSEDVKAIREGLKKGYLEVISTDHAPHSDKEKALSIKDAPFGIVGLETAFALSYSELVLKGVIDIDTLVKYMSSNPASIAGIPGGSLSPGSVADITIADINSEYVIDKNTFLSMGKNTPFDGRKVSGKIKYTIVSGKVVYKD